MKDNKVAELLRHEGNFNYKLRKFRESLIYYNKSLCFSPESSENFALIFGNRSAVYFETHQYGKCLENIELALAHNHPNHKQLKQREKKTRKLLDTQKKPQKFFTLSHPANEMIPFIISCIELRQDENLKSFVVTTEDLNPGDVIAIEEICFKTIEESARFSRCAFCLNSNKLSLIPCDRGCSCTMFCDKHCEAEGLKKFHAIECGHVDNLYHKHEKNTTEKMFDPFDMLRALTESLLITQPVDRDSLLNQSMLMDDENPETLFDFDLGRKSDEMLEIKQLQIVNLLESDTSETLRWIYEDAARQLLEKFPVFENVVKCDDDLEFVVQYIVRFMQILKRNRSKIIVDGKVEGAGVQLFGSLLRHSCDPNVVRVSIDNKFACVVTKPIKKNEQLLVSFQETFAVQRSRNKRRSKLSREFNFICSCDACKNDYDLMKMPRIDGNFTFPPFDLPEDHENLVIELQKNCEYIKNNFNRYPSLELCVLEMRNKVLLGKIAEKESWMEE